jgi:hypothetical protein
VSENDSKVKIVKVKPYPIDCLLKKSETAPPIKCDILKLETSGFIFKINNTYFKVGDEFICEFILPVMNKKVIEKIKIVKTYQAATTDVSRPTTVEVHFKDQVHKFEDDIRKFIFQIDQKDP